MTDLSPAVQAVIHAYKVASDGHYTAGGEWIQNHEAQIAAALRAAAVAPPEIDLPLSKVVEWEKIEGVCVSYYAAAEWGYRQALAHISTIANELEASNE
jgi:hypothetical protein